MRRRSNTTIWRMILRVCWKEANAGGAGKTRIVYGANLSFNSATRYLDQLQDEGVLIKTKDKYEITKKGLDLCQKLADLPAALGGTT